MVRGLLALLLILCAGCRQGGSSRGVTPSVSAAEALLGRQAAPALEKRYGGIASDLEASGRMDRIGRRLAAATPALDRVWHFRLLGSDEVNAFSLPGELIYVTRGLYERTRVDEVLLAAVIAHEMGHVLRRDSLKPRCGNVRNSLIRETEADRLAAGFLTAAGYHAGSLKDVLRLIEDVQPPGWADARIDSLAPRGP